MLEVYDKASGEWRKTWKEKPYNKERVYWVDRWKWDEQAGDWIPYTQLKYNTGSDEINECTVWNEKTKKYMPYIQEMNCNGGDIAASIIYGTANRKNGSPTSKKNGVHIPLR